MNTNPSNVRKQQNPPSVNPTTLAQNYNAALAQYTASLGGNKSTVNILGNKSTVNISGTIKNTTTLSGSKNTLNLSTVKNTTTLNANKNTTNLSSIKNTANIAGNKNAATFTGNKNGTEKSNIKSKAGVTLASGIAPIASLKSMNNTGVVTEELTVATSSTVAEKLKDDSLQRLTGTRNKVIHYYANMLDDLKMDFQETLTELFFIQSGGNMVDYPAWKMRPTAHLVSYLTSQRLDDSKLVFPSISSTSTTKSDTNSRKSATVEKTIKQEPVEGGSLVEQYGFVQGSHSTHDHKDKSSKHTESRLSTHGNIDNKSTLNFKPPSIHRPSSSSGTVTDIAGQVRHESETLHRISELRKNGLWSASRLPKVFELPRKKSHSDFMLEEMQWLATDFAQEKRWKRNMAKKVSRSIMKYHQDRAVQEKRRKREETVRLRRIASGIAKEVKNFWQQIEKVATHKQQSRQEEQRRKALDLHLNFIVGQTEKYSSWLAEGMKESSVSSPASEYTETDAKEEDESSEGGSEEEEDYQDELDALKKDSEMPMEDLLGTLSENMIKRITGEAHSDSETDVDDGGSSEDDEEDSDDGDSDHRDSDDESDDEGENSRMEESEVKSLGKDADIGEDDGGDFVVEDNEDAKDDEETIAEEENQQEGADYKSELDDLQKEGELPIEELLKLYGQPSTPMDSAMETDDEEESDADTLVEKLEDSKDASVNKDAEAGGVATTEELDSAAATAESLQPKGFTLSTTQVRTTIPSLLRGTLREYQHIGLDWLVTMYTKQLNGILADEMGLGKTIQTIALLAHLACEEGTWGPHLIVVPTSVMLNWEFEFKKWCPGFKILTYFGSQKERKLKRTGWSKPNAFHVCITSYKLVIQDHAAFRRRKWKYLILDEAQNIKNFKSQRWQMLLNFNSQRRLLLTGTPLQNNLMELWSLMHFLMPNIFQSHQDFKEWFSNPLTGMIEGSREYHEGTVKRLHSVLRPFLLRRLKAEVELQMPKKYEHVIKCRLSKRQRFLYDEFMSRTKTKETLEAGNFLSVINILMQLRKVCNHPDLFELRPTVAPLVMEDSLEYIVPSVVNKTLDYDPHSQIDLSSLNLCISDLELTMTAFQAHRTQQLKVQKSLIQELDNNDIVDCSYVVSSGNSSKFTSLSNLSEGKTTTIAESEEKRNLFDVLKDSCTSSANNTPQDSESSDVEYIDCEKSSEESNEEPPQKKQKLEEENLPVNDGKRLIDRFMVTNSSEFTLPIMTEKAQVQQKRRFDLLATINERHCSATPVYGSDLIASMKIMSTKSSRFTGALSHQISRKKLCDCMCDMIKLPKTRFSDRKGITDRYSIYVHRLITFPISMKTINAIPNSERTEKQLSQCISTGSKGKFDLYHPITIHTMLQFPETRLVQYDCGKLQALDRLLRQMKIGKHKGLIFTQMTRMLDVLERFLNYHGYIYVRLDGSTKVEQRQVLMERFNQDEKIFIFILSTRSGGVGVNLTGADTVIFYDSDWNPTMDAQAQDRCHRIGQTRDVHIYRLISDRTVEENILKKAHQKRMLCDLAIEGGNFTTAFFKKDSVRDLFNTSTEEQEEEMDVVVPTVKKIEPSEKPEAVEEEKTEKAEAPITDEQYEKVLAETEEKDDVVAAEKAKLEQDSELSEFNDNVPLDGTGGENSKVEKALSMLEAELKPVERLALRFMESTNSYQVDDEVEETEKMLEQKKKDWELNHLQSLKEAEERKNAEEEDEMLFTYIRDETYDQVKKSAKKTPRNKRSSKASTTSNDNEIIDVDNLSCDDSNNKNLHVNIQPLLLKLGEKRIAEIKKTAQETIQARNDLTKSSPVKSPSKKPSLNSGSKKPIQKANVGRPKAAAREKTIVSFAKLEALKSSIEIKTDKKPTRQLRKAPPINIDKTPTISKTRTAVTLKDFVSKTTPLSTKLQQNNINGRGSPKERISKGQTTLGVTPISSGTSSPNSLGSPDSLSGDIRRSSRTPRPKVMDDEWIVN